MAIPLPTLPRQPNPAQPDCSALSACILAGGLGTRLRGVVDKLPKVLAPVGGRPFLAHQLDWLEGQGVRRAVLCVGHLAGMVYQEFGSKFGALSLDYSEETEPLGTGGALFLALPRIATDTLLLLNGDSFNDLALGSALAWHQARNSEATLILTHVEDGARYGRVRTDDQGRVLSMDEKDGLASPAWINSGANFFSTSALRRLSRPGACSLERDILGSWVGAGLHGYRQEGAFLDIGIPEDYARAPDFLAACRTLPRPARTSTTPA